MVGGLFLYGCDHHSSKHSRQPPAGPGRESELPGCHIIMAATAYPRLQALRQQLRAARREAGDAVGGPTTPKVKHVAAKAVIGGLIRVRNHFPGEATQW